MAYIERTLRCRRCGETTTADAARWRCACGGLYDLSELDLGRASEAVGPEASLWRYRTVLPFDPGSSAPSRLTMGEGWTPLIAEDLDGIEVSFKLEYLAPTGSFKDRGAVVLVAKALELGADEVIADSSGNAGAAISAYAARAKLPCTVFVPSATSARKLRQMQAHGATVIPVQGPRANAASAAIAAVDGRRAFYASHVYSPYFFEGTKTYAYEVLEQLGRVPDVIVLPVGNGTLVLGVVKALGELTAADKLERPPRLVLVQAERCAPLASAHRAGRSTVATVTDFETAAEGIAIAEPPRGDQLLELASRLRASFVTVTEDEIAEAGSWLASRGYYVEPTGAAPLAGWLAVRRDASFSRDLTCVIPLSGSGLKTA